MKFQEVEVTLRCRNRRKAHPAKLDDFIGGLRLTLDAQPKLPEEKP